MNGAATMKAAARLVYDDVMAAMQNAEEIGGPGGLDYFNLMRAIREECARRIYTYSDIRHTEPCDANCENRHGDMGRCPRCKGEYPGNGCACGGLCDECLEEYAGPRQDTEPRDWVRHF